MNVRFLTLLLLFSGSFLFGQTDADIPLATVGGITITKKEFLSRYELTPGINRRPGNTEANKAEFLLSLIAEKLIVSRSRAEGWENDTVLTNAVREIERLLARDELYRREIQQKVKLSEKEIAEGIRRSLNDRKVYFLFAQTKRSADSLYRLIRGGRPLEHFQIADSLNAVLDGPDSAIARFGDVDERMEQAVYGLELNETAPPILLDDGWYIVKLMGKTVTVLAGEKERRAQREKVELILRKRKEQHRMTEFMNAELRSIRTDVNPKVLRSTIFHLWEVTKHKHPVRNDSTLFLIERSVADSIHRRMGDSASLPLVTFPHTVWTAGMTIMKLADSHLAIPAPTLQRIRQDVERRLRDVIDQEYLVQSAYRRELHQSAAVREDVKVWRDVYSASLVRKRISDTVTVSAEEVKELQRLFSSDTSIARNDSIATLKLREMKTSDALDRYVGTIANSTEITFFEQNFTSVKVSNTPSLVYRYLGFGGRMFAAPFVAPQIGWINYWNNKNIQLP